jgi:uncharacterized protein YegP (UPF0339 family)
MTEMKIETFLGKDGWRWRMRARNGEILSTSEAYVRKHDAEKTAQLVRDAFAKEEERTDEQEPDAI